MEEQPKIVVEETNLEDLILLGEDKLIDCTFEYPTENGFIKTKAKIKQLTMKEMKNINLKDRTFQNSVKILTKTLYKQDGTPFDEELILKMPVGVVNILSNQIMELSGVDVDEVKKP